MALATGACSVPVPDLDAAATDAARPTDSASAVDTGVTHDGGLARDAGRLVDAAGGVDAPTSGDAATPDDAGSVTAPRPIAPLSTSTVTSRRPRLHWALPPGADGARVELCHDRACTEVLATVDAAGSSTTPPSDLPTGVVFWRLHARTGTTTSSLSSPTWQFHVGARSAPIDTSWGSTLDVNGDGHADVAAGGVLSGELYLGSSTGLGPTSDWSRTGRTASIGSAGDIDGDGYGDLIAAGGSRGAELYRGGSTGLAATSDWATLDAAEIAAGVGDVNADGYADVVVLGSAAQLYLGSATGLATVASWSRVASISAVAGAGDVNGDGYADVVFGAYPDTVDVFLGTATGLDAGASRTGLASSNFGWSVAGAGDVDGDGYADIVVGSTGGPAAVSLFRGGPSGVEATPSWTHATIGTQLGDTVACTGDVDGNGYDDIVVEAKGTCHTMCPGGSCTTTCDGAVYLWAGGPVGLAADPAWSQIGPPDSDFGERVAGAGDVDADGYADIVVGASHAASVFLYAGALGFPSATPAWSVTMPADFAFGWCVASADAPAASLRPRSLAG